MIKKHSQILLSAVAVILATVCCLLPSGSSAFSLRAGTDPEPVPTTQTARQTAAAETQTEKSAANLQNATETQCYISSPPATHADTPAGNEPATETASPSDEAPSAPQTPDPVTKHTDMRADEIYKEALRTAEDEYWYHFTVKERGMVRFTLALPSVLNLSGCIARLYQVYYLNGVGGETGLRLLETLNVFAADGSGTSPNLGVIPGEYCILVTSGDVTELAEYTLQMQFEARTDYEIECNDTPSRYTELVSGIQLRGSASHNESGTDRDWYLFRMYRAGAIELKFRHTTGKLSTTAFKVTLFNDRFEELYTGLSPFNLGTLKSGSLGAEPGVYYVCVENRIYYPADYGLTLTAVTGSAYETEPNDTPDDACFLMENTPMTGAVTAKNDLSDKDWYYGTLKNPGFVRLTLSAAGGEEGKKRILRLTLQNADGETVYACLMNDAETEIRTPEIGLPAGEFYVRIDNEDLYVSKGDYTLQYTFSADAHTETEPNDTPDGADALSEGGSVTGAVTDGEQGFDTDVYRITSDKDQRVELGFTHSAQTSSGPVYTLELVREDGSAVSAVDGTTRFDIKTDQTKTACVYELQKGVYYLKICAGLFADGGRYTVTYHTAE